MNTKLCNHDLATLFQYYHNQIIVEIPKFHQSDESFPKKKIFFIYIKVGNAC